MQTRTSPWWLIFISTLVPVAVAAGVGALVPLSDLQMWWHLSFGRAADGFARIPNAIHVSYLVGVDTPSFIQPWLSQWWMYKVESVLGLPGLVFLRTWIVALGLAVTTYVGLREHDAWQCRLVAVAVGVAAATVGALNPATFGALFVALTVAALVVSRTWRWALVIPVLLAPVWINVDASFYVGAGLMVAAALVRRRRDVSLAAVLFVAATFVSPRHYHVWVETLAQWEAPGIMTMIAALGAVGALGGFAKTQWFTSEDRALAAVLVLGCLVASNPVGMLIGLPALVRGDAGTPNLGWLIAGVLLTAATILVQPLWAWHPEIADGFGSSTVSKSVPTEAAQIVASWGSRPRFYNAPELAGMLLWELTREGFYPVVFQDERSLGPEFDALRRTVDEAPGVWRGVFQQNGIKAAFLSLPQQERLAAEIAADPQWHVAWESDRHVLLAR
ncbi:MAG: hypothetical protein R3E66_08755 [bacterium]